MSYNIVLLLGKGWLGLSLEGSCSAAGFGHSFNKIQSHFTQLSLNCIYTI
jgi:hypothetical protein